VDLSTAEPKYIAVCMEVREAMSLRKLLAGLFGQMLDPTVIHCDNQSCVKLSENPISHDTPRWTELSMTLIDGLISCIGLVPSDPWGVAHVVGIFSRSYSLMD
jgi:hypothetical protein